MREIRYLIVGAGGIGGSIAGTLASSGKDVTLIARGAQLKAIRQNGIVLISDAGGARTERTVTNIKVSSSEEYERPGADEAEFVVFICVKSYHVPGIEEFLDRIADDETIMIPILNGMCMGEYIRGYVSRGIVLDGCTYLSAMKDGPGRFLMMGDRFRLVFGGDGLSPKSTVDPAGLEHIAEDLRSAGIDAEASGDILTHSVKKASFVAASAGAGLYYDTRVGGLQVPGEPRDMVRSIAGEMQSLAEAIGVSFGFDLRDDILRSLDGLSPDTESSLQRDIASGGPSEFDSLILNPLRIGAEHGVEMPALRTVAERFASSSGR